MAQVPTAPDPHLEQIRIVAEILRGILRGALAGGVAGVLVLGLGGRLVMRFAAILNPDATGRATENGNLIGDITLGGTLALVTFSGLFLGLLASVVWTTIAPWVPGTGIRRALLAAPAAVALGGFGVMESDNVDFLILGSDLLIVAMFLGLIAAFGFGVSILDERFDRRLPRPGPDPVEFALGTLALVVLGAILFLPALVVGFASERACLCDVGPLPMAAPLLVTGLATLASWVLRARRGIGPGALIQAMGRVGLLTAIVLGGAILITEVAAIPM